MKVQTTVLLLCFLSGVFLYSVVHAKPSPALMKELIALEKYLEKKQGSDGGDGQDKNQNEQSIGDNELGSFLNSIDKNNEQIKPNDNGQDKTVNENSNNVGGEANNAVPDENQVPDGAVSPEKPEGVTPAKPEGVTPVKPEGVTPVKPNEGVTLENTEVVSASSGGGEDGEKPQEGNGPMQSVGQEETESEHALADLDKAYKTFKTALHMLEPLINIFREQFQTYEGKFKGLKEKYEQTKEKTKEKTVQLTSLVEDINRIADDNSDKKKAVRENAPARRSHLSDTEFLNIVHSLLTDN